MSVKWDPDRGQKEQLREWHRALFLIKRVPSTMHASSQSGNETCLDVDVACGSSSGRMGSDSPWPSRDFLTSVSSASRMLLAGARMYCKRRLDLGVCSGPRWINVGRCRISVPPRMCSAKCGVMGEAGSAAMPIQTPVSQ